MYRIARATLVGLLLGLVLAPSPVHPQRVKDLTQVQGVRNNQLVGYGLVVGLDGTGTGNPTGVAYVAGANISSNGWTTQISGTPAAGDTFTVGPDTGGVADNRNALLLAALQTTNTVANGAASLIRFQQAYQASGRVLAIATTLSKWSSPRLSTSSTSATPTAPPQPGACRRMR